MGLRARLEKAREAQSGTLQVTPLTRTGEQVAMSPWVKKAQEGARIGQPLNGRGLPVRVER